MVVRQAALVSDESALERVCDDALYKLTTFTFTFNWSLDHCSAVSKVSSKFVHDLLT